MEGKNIIVEGDEGNNFYIIRSGEVKCTKGGQEVRQQPCPLDSPHSLIRPCSAPPHLLLPPASLATPQRLPHALRHRCRTG